MTWQPGDPLWIDHPMTGVTRPMFSVIPDMWGGLGVGAHWPDPGEWDLGEGDELGVFINECKRMEGAA